MKRIYDWAARPQSRTLTAADLRALKGQRTFTQTTANTEEEAAAAQDAGLDLIMGNAQNTAAARAGAPNLFFTAALALPDYPTEAAVLNAAFAAMKEGADSVYTARGPHIVELLAREEIPVMCHLGLVPRKSTWRGGLRAIGKTADEALDLWQAFRRMEDAGAFSVEAEVICAPVMAEITRRTTLLTSSLGSGAGADILYLFQNDICGEGPTRPRHARAFGDLYGARRAALSAFRDAALDGSFPAPEETAGLDPAEFDAFLKALG